jgi:CRISPR/Cas system-associated endoribonuclease Cas2
MTYDIEAAKERRRKSQEKTYTMELSKEEFMYLNEKIRTLSNEKTDLQNRILFYQLCATVFLVATIVLFILGIMRQ